MLSRVYTTPIGKVRLLGHGVGSPTTGTDEDFVRVRRITDHAHYHSAFLKLIRASHHANEDALREALSALEELHPDDLAEIKLRAGRVVREVDKALARERLRSVTETMIEKGYAERVQEQVPA